MSHLGKPAFNTPQTPVTECKLLESGICTRNRGCQQKERCKLKLSDKERITFT